MRNKLTWFWAIVFLLLIPIVSADVILPSLSVTFFPVVLIIEIIGFWLLANKVFNIQVGFWKSLLIVTVANVVTTIVGTIIERFNLYLDIGMGFILVAFILSILIEFGIFLLFFIRKDIKRINLLWISGIINAASYLVLGISIFLF